MLSRQGRRVTLRAAIVFTEASYHVNDIAAVDATDATFSKGEKTAVGTPQWDAPHFPSRQRVLWSQRLFGVAEIIGIEIDVLPSGTFVGGEIVGEELSAVRAP